ncbi:unnamed protein product [Owenia fusiformis]|uniref:Uncharacterized protein n=1 Tax=Owenia fusiformis TaxID=6347 RepID=A0A8J1TCM6_OWEFU|nr:unnamed protein product [Owenia fusiformis]
MIGFDRLAMGKLSVVEWAELESEKVLMDSETLEELIDKKEVDINAADQYGDNALIYTVRNNATNCTKLLLDHGADVNAVNNYGKTALMYAASVNDSVECVNLLIAYGADIDARDNDGATALIHARSKCMCILVDKGADVNATNKIGLTTLMWAATFSNTAPMEALLDHGADVNACINSEMNALFYPVCQDNPESVKLLNYPGMNALFFAVCHDNLDLVRLLIKKGADVNTSGPYNETVLMRSVCSPDPACLVLLLANGADINKVNHAGKDAMSFAFEYSTFGIETYRAICILALYGAPFDAEQSLAFKKLTCRSRYSKLGVTLEDFKQLDLQQQVRLRMYQYTTRVCRKTYSKTIDALIKGGKLPERFRWFMLFEDDIEDILGVSGTPHTYVEIAEETMPRNKPSCRVWC